MPRVVEFENLHRSDLTLGTIYRGGSQGTIADDPLARIMPVGNQGGFRYKGSPVQETVRLVAMFTTGEEHEWPDHLQESTGILTYFGDNRQPGQKLLETRRKGNVLLRSAFTATYRTNLARSRVPPFFLFEKEGKGRDVQFRGLLAPGVARSSMDADLQSVWRQTLGGKFENYAAKFTRLDVDNVSRKWIDSLSGGALPVDGQDCPVEWRDWVDSRRYNTPAT